MAMYTVQRRADEALRDFSPAEKVALTGEIALSYLHVCWLMRRGDFRDALARVRRTPARGERIGPAFAGRLGAIVEGRLRLLPGDTRCLMKSLVLLRLLARRRYAATLVIGVRTDPDFLAHAWVELDGRSLLRPIHDTSARLVEL
jgi:Transglutaminase-like superfamily